MVGNVNDPSSLIPRIDKNNSQISDKESNQKFQRTTSSVNKITVKILQSPEKTWSDHVWTGIKVVFFPLTLIVYGICKFCSEIASSKGLGEEAEVKSVNSNEREQLKNLDGQEILFGFEGGHILEGMYFQACPNTPNSKTILICTGSHKSYEYYAIPMVKAFKDMGHNVMVFNYEGFGNSEGGRSEEGIYRSVEAAYQYLIQEKRCKDKDIIAWGYSLGSGAASDLGTRHEIDIVLDRGFSTMSEVAYQQAPEGLKTVARVIFAVGAHFDNVSKLKDVKGNILVAQGSNDNTMTEKEHGMLLREASPKVTYLKVESLHHHFDSVWFGDEDAQKIHVNKFLKKEKSA